MNRNFYLHNYDTWHEQPRSEFDVGDRCRGNIQIHRLTEAGGLEVYVTANSGEYRDVHFYLPGLPFRMAYETAWRVKRLLDHFRVD